MKHYPHPLLLLFTLLALLLSSCNLPTGAIEEPTAESAPIAATSTPSPTETPAPEVISHLVQPINSTLANNQLIPDCDTGIRSQPERPDIRQPCDVWARNYLERPANRELNQYYPNLDILRAQMGQDSEWYYAWIKLYETAVVYDPYATTYAFEFDLDFDARGDILILVAGLPINNADWTTDGVQVWADTNKDVGGSTPAEPDGQPGNGYETLIFDGGKGDDPDLAWARRSPTAANQIEFAFKPTAVNNAATFSWMAWAFRSDLTPAQFDFQDSIDATIEYEFDNTCSWVFGGPLRGLRTQCDLTQPTPIPEQQACVPTTPRPTFLHYWDPTSCSWKMFVLVFPTPTEIIIK